jgi:hypothetical protein
MVVGFGALVAQILGLLIAIATPYESQGAVGKAFAAIFTQFAAIPLGVLGLILALAVRYFEGRFSKSNLFGMAAAIAGLVPLSMVYVSVVR